MYSPNELKATASTQVTGINVTCVISVIQQTLCILLTPEETPENPNIPPNISLESFQTNPVFSAVAFFFLQFSSEQGWGWSPVDSTEIVYASSVPST